MEQLNFLEEFGFKYKTVSCSRLPELEREYISLLRSSNFNLELYEKSISKLNFRIPDDFPGAQSVIVIAVPSFRSEASFHYRGESYGFTIPPTYRGYNEKPADALKILSEYLEPMGYRAVYTSLPQKLLAVRSGLAYYGKNNITYVDGLGSFYQLVSFYSNLPADENSWYDLRMLERCSRCSACVKVCPTQAIIEDRFLINAEKCLTFFNENGYDFPEWIDPVAHNSLIGCMLCQYNCPENKKYRDKVEFTVDFSEAETEFIINSESPDGLEDGLREKIGSLDLLDTHTDYSNLRRNLLTLLYKT